MNNSEFIDRVQACAASSRITLSILSTATARPASRDVRTADPSADGRRSAAMFGSMMARLATKRYASVELTSVAAYRLIGPGAIACCILDDLRLPPTTNMKSEHVLNI